MSRLLTACEFRVATPPCCLRHRSRLRPRLNLSCPGLCPVQRRPTPFTLVRAPRLTCPPTPHGRPRTTRRTVGKRIGGNPAHCRKSRPISQAERITSRGAQHRGRRPSPVPSRFTSAGATPPESATAPSPASRPSPPSPTGSGPAFTAGLTPSWGWLGSQALLGFRPAVFFAAAFLAGAFFAVFFASPSWGASSRGRWHVHRTCRGPPWPA